MFSRLKQWVEKAWQALLTFVRNVTTLATFFSLPVLVAVFFVYMFKGEYVVSLLCLAGIYTFLHLNESL